MSVKTNSVKLSFSFTCPIEGKPVEMELTDLDRIHFYTLTRFYDDTDDGQVMEYMVTCPHCQNTHEIEVYRKNGWGM